MTLFSKDILTYIWKSRRYRLVPNPIREVFLDGTQVDLEEGKTDRTFRAPYSIDAIDHRTDSRLTYFPEQPLVDLEVDPPTLLASTSDTFLQAHSCQC